jgi:pyridoxal phosphate enzyme (YggS family)
VSRENQQSSVNPKTRLGENLARIGERIAAAAHRSGRPPTDITLVAVTKYVNANIVPLLVAVGCTDIGESRPQELWSKAESLTNLPVRWHLVGHLQRNKVDRTLPLVSLIHSVDSLRLAQAIDQSAAKSNRHIPALLEVNISADSAKHGVAPAEIEPLLQQLVTLNHVEIRGLMAMASPEGDLDAGRRQFAALRQLRDGLRSVAPPCIKLIELSMGMSGDFEIAIEEGATIVRIGSALFEGIIQ